MIPFHICNVNIGKAFKDDKMERLKALNPDTTTGKSKDLFDGIQSKLGMVPNMMRTMGNSPAVLEAYLNLSGALSSGTLGAKLGELLASSISTQNGCDYCVSAHDFIGQNLAKIPGEELEAARRGHSNNPKIQAALTFATALVSTRGQVSDAEVNAVKSAGYKEGEIAEIIGHVALNIFTNYLNNTAQTAVDFPVLEAA